MVIAPRDEAYLRGVEAAVTAFLGILARVFEDEAAALEWLHER